MIPANFHTSSWIVGASAFVATALLGWNLAAPSSKTARETDSPADAGRTRSRPPRAPRSMEADVAGRRVAAIRSATSAAARMQATIDLAYSISPADFGAWLGGNWFNLRGGPELTLFTKIIEERWKLEDPEGLLLWSLDHRTSASSALLVEWSAKDPQRLLDFFRKHPNDDVEMGMLRGIAKTRPDLALQRVLELTAGGYTGRGRGDALELFRVVAGQSPAALEASIAGFPAELRLQAEMALSRGRLESSFPEEMRRLYEHPNGWEILAANAYGLDFIGLKIFAELENFPASWKQSIGSNPYYFIDEASAQQWLDADLKGLGFSQEAMSLIHFRAIRALAGGNPEEAIRRIGTMEWSEEDRANLIANIIGSSRDGKKVREMFIALGSDEDRRVIASFAKSESGESPEPKKVETPAEWIERFGDSGSGGADTYFLIRNLDDWDASKISALTGRFKNLPDESKHQMAVAIGAGHGNLEERAPGLVGEAIRYLVENPGEPAAEGSRYFDPVSTSSRYVVQLSVKDPEAASDWVMTLPNGKARSWAQKNLVNNWRQYDPQAAEKWEKSLPQADRVAMEKLGQKSRN